MSPRASFWLAVALVASLLPAAASSGEAGKRPRAVVELFTSQGCNSCPPADALLARLADGGDVVALAFHVDYWDYLGWRDTLASAQNTERQNAYSRAFGNRSVYTPQIVVNGRRHMSGAKTHAVESAIGRLDDAGEGMTVDVAARYTGDSIVIETGPGVSVGGYRKAHVVLAFFEPSRIVEIEGGKNDGKTITYRNSVLATQTAGMWRGEAARFELPMSDLAGKGAGGCAVLLQSVAKDGTPGPILGAAIIPVPES